MQAEPVLICSCEHGGNRVPQEFAFLFKHGRRALASHRGLDKGALVIARAVAGRLGAPLVYAETSRLLIDLNRSLHHRGLYSEFTRGCPAGIREALIERIYKPYRAEMNVLVRKAVKARRPVIHLSFHSFSPRLNGVERKADIGLLYDPSRPREKTLCRRLQAFIRGTSGCRVRLNYPYRGTADGHTTALRRAYPDSVYAGIEIEINQKFATGGNRRLPAISDLLYHAIKDALKTV